MSNSSSKSTSALLIKNAARGGAALQVEAAGIEPAENSDATTYSICTCEKCQERRAANALHLERLKSQLLASFDTDLQRVISQWNELPKAIRRAICALLEGDA